jgi:hypothetical protein
MKHIGFPTTVNPNPWDDAGEWEDQERRTAARNELTSPPSGRPREASSMSLERTRIRPRRDPVVTKSPDLSGRSRRSCSRSRSWSRMERKTRRSRPKRVHSRSCVGGSRLPPAALRTTTSELQRNPAHNALHQRSARQRYGVVCIDEKPCKEGKPTPGLEPGTPSLRVMGVCHDVSRRVTSGLPSRRILRTAGDCGRPKMTAA